ncbi:MAG: radical SAM protein [bacterium]|nr:radical SAM protein [bacterium]
MECAVITTYRCNAHCQMCYSWKHPTRPEDEITPEILDKIPCGMKRLNITGGEPMLRNDIEAIIEVLNKKTKRLEISTNGYFTQRIIQVAKKYPNITIRVSIEGLPKLNDRLMGLKDGFDHGLRTVLRLKEMGIKDVGFSMVISDKNVKDLLDLYHLMVFMDLEFATATIHNSFYFFKHDNKIEDISAVTEEMQKFVRALLSSKRESLRMRIKDWLRAYFNFGLLNYIYGNVRPLPCVAGIDSFFLDPYGNVLACNGSDTSWIMGNLKEKDFDEIWHSEQARRVREKVKNCTKNCWMTGTAVPAMRKQIWKPTLWVLKNKIRDQLRRDAVS